MSCWIQPITCHLNRLQSLMVGLETIIQTKKCNISMHLLSYSNSKNDSRWRFGFYCLFVSRPTIRLCSLFKVRHVMIINHDSSRLLLWTKMRLSYDIHLGFGKTFRRTWKSNHGPSDRESSTVPLDQSSHFSRLKNNAY